MSASTNTTTAAKKAGVTEERFTDLSDSCFTRSVCSSTDCTGLIPALPSSRAELEAYEDMYQFVLANPPAASSEKE